MKLWFKNALVSLCSGAKRTALLSYLQKQKVELHRVEQMFRANTNSMKSRDESFSVDVCALKYIIAQFLSIVSMVPDVLHLQLSDTGVMP